MVYLFLIISLIFNACLILKIKKFKKVIKEFYCTDEELDDVLNRL